MGRSGGVKGGDQAQLPFVKSQKCGAVNCSVLVRTAAPSLPTPLLPPGGGRAHHLRSARWTSRVTNASVKSHHGPCHTEEQPGRKAKEYAGRDGSQPHRGDEHKEGRTQRPIVIFDSIVRKRAAINRWVNYDEGSRTTVARHPLRCRVEILLLLFF